MKIDMKKNAFKFLIILFLFALIIISLIFAFQSGGGL